jgi:hypothetical protein
MSTLYLYIFYVHLIAQKMTLAAVDLNREHDWGGGGGVIAAFLMVDSCFIKSS